MLHSLFMTTKAQVPTPNPKARVPIPNPKCMDGGGGQTGIQFGVYGGSGSEYFTMNSDMTVLVPGAKATLDVKADGNVKLVLTGLHHRVYKTAAEGGEYSHSDKIDATLTIRCVDPVQ